MRTVGLSVFLACLLSIPAPSAAQDRVIGLLALPDVLGTGPCEPFVPADVPLHASPDGPVTGAIHVPASWTLHSDGGCDALDAKVLIPGQAETSLPVEEYEYEAAGAIVLQQRGRWFRLRLADGSAWVHASQRSTFHPLAALLENGLTFLTAEWDQRLAAEPARPARATRAEVDSTEQPVRVTRSAHVGAALWLHVELLSHSGCQGEDEPEVVDRGWVPAHARSGKPIVWFYSRGC